MRFATLRDHTMAKIPSSAIPMNFKWEIEGEERFKYFYSKKENNLFKLSTFYRKEKGIYIIQILEWKNIYNPSIAIDEKFNGVEGEEIYKKYFTYNGNGEYREVNFI